MVKIQFDTKVEDTVKLNIKTPSDELAHTIDCLFQKERYATRIHAEAERQAIRGVTTDNHEMVQAVLTRKHVIYIRCNNAQYDLNQLPVWEPSVEGTAFYAIFPRNEMA